MNEVAALTVSLLLLSCPAVFGQDAMKYGVKHLTVLAEDQKVRVLRYAPSKGDKTPMHSHPSTVVYVLKGGDHPPLSKAVFVDRNVRQRNMLNFCSYGATLL